MASRKDGNGHQSVRDAHYYLVERSAVARREAEYEPKGHDAQGHAGTDLQGDAASIEDPGVDVPPQVVGPEEMVGSRRDEPVARHEEGGIDGSQEWREYCDEEHHHDDNEPEGHVRVLP